MLMRAVCSGAHGVVLREHGLFCCARLRRRGGRVGLGRTPLHSLRARSEAAAAQAKRRTPPASIRGSLFPVAFAKTKKNGIRSRAVKKTFSTPPGRQGTVFFFVIAFFVVSGTLLYRKALVRFSPAWAPDPQLGLVARCAMRRSSANPLSSRGLCHWAGELTARQAAEPPS